MKDLDLDTVKDQVDVIASNPMGVLAMPEAQIMVVDQVDNKLSTLDVEGVD